MSSDDRAPFRVILTPKQKAEMDAALAEPGVIHSAENIPEGYEWIPGTDACRPKTKVAEQPRVHAPSADSQN